MLVLKCDLAFKVIFRPQLLATVKKFFVFSCHQCVTSSMEPGDNLDNDCDGKYDEEIKDGKDNDLDGKVDEDLEKVIHLEISLKHMG